ncbi:hypothetical protein EX30DRAFT_61106 [Ascodesmis nigricans]|uniref:Uncharacterized protein n=1 Tax=Ascodesmis nigricans TaxID=341454 RepID=A0A4S2MU83_9PEZI|nr:hypothetical protein EX30DRAFT_61106 [Ascodesmis nigricans]
MTIPVTLKRLQTRAVCFQLLAFLSACARCCIAVRSFFAPNNRYPWSRSCDSHSRQILTRYMVIFKRLSITIRKHHCHPLLLS